MAEATARKLHYGDEVQVVSSVMKKIANEIIELVEHLDRVPSASAEIVEEHKSRINNMLAARCTVLESLSKLL